MAKIGQQGQPGGGGGTYTETPEQKEAWRKLRSYMRSLNLGEGDTFTVKGTIAKILLETGDRYFTKKVTNDKGEEKDWPFVKVLAAITDPQFGTPGTLDFPAKHVGASFFDGVTKKGRSPNRGGMYSLHRAVTGQEPGEDLKANTGSWDTEDYENKPVLLRLSYEGKEEAGSAYADRRLGMKLFINGFEKDPDVHRAASDLDDEDDDAPFPPATPAGSPATIAAAKNFAATTSAGNGQKASEAASNADLSVLPATDRQVQFIYNLGRECGMGREETAGMAEGLYEAEPEMLTRKEASTFIDTLRRKQLDTPLPAEEGTDELVGVGVATGPTRKVVPDDDDDLSF